MTREQALQEVKSRYAEYLPPAKKDVAGLTTYICPLCGHGKGGDGLQIVPEHKGGDGTRLHCFTCGFHGTIVDLYQREHNCSTGEAIRALYDRFNIRIDAEATRRPVERTEAQDMKSPNPPAENAAAASTEGSFSEQKDFTAYYKTCWQHRADPAAVEYLNLRGISPELAECFCIGYDPAGYVVIPCSSSFYVARATDPAAKLRYRNPAGASAEIFNASALYNDTGRPVFVVEGAFDALSIIQAGGEAVALNSTSNVRKLLKDLEAKHTDNTLIICLDNDGTGKRTSDELAEGLRALDVATTTADICGACKDPNEALTADPAAFTELVAVTEKKVLFPGLLTTDRAVQILDAVDDHYLDLPSFPQLSAMAKIRTHDTIVIAADTGAGKSSLALNLLHELQDRYPAIYINLEMDEATVLQRLVAIHTGLELDVIEGYKHDKNTQREVNTAIKEILARREIQLLADVYDLKEIEARIKAATSHRTEPTIVFIDTGLLVTTGNKSASRYERFTQISEELRRISRLNNIVMFVLLQQSREGKKDEKKEPTNSSLKESGSWENDATKIIFLWDNPRKKCKELAATKNRNGKTGSIELNYSPHTQTYKERSGTFTDLDDDSDDLPAVFAMRI